MDPIVIGLVSACAGYIGGHMHAKIGSSSCMYGLCTVSGVNFDVDKDATTNTNAVDVPINNHN